MFICSMVDYGIHTYIEAVVCCEVKIKNDIFVFLFGMFSEVMFLKLPLFWVFHFSTRLKGFVSALGSHLFFRITEFISGM